jgi:hypothetical protein
MQLSPSYAHRDSAPNSSSTFSSGLPSSRTWRELPTISPGRTVGSNVPSSSRYSSVAAYQRTSQHTTTYGSTLSSVSSESPHR